VKWFEAATLSKVYFFDFVKINFGLSSNKGEFQWCLWTDRTTDGQSKLSDVILVAGLTF